jgi:predicted TIM-barrel fold metal-dependent hydrolase
MHIVSLQFEIEESRCRKDFMVVDSDAHISEPLDIFEQYLEEPYLSRRPRIVEDTLGFTRIILEGRLYPDPRLRQLRGNHNHGATNDVPVTTEEHDLARGIVGCRGQIGGLHAGAADAKARLDDLDREGIDVQLVLGNLGLAVSALPDKDFAVAMSRACNSYYSDFCNVNRHRLKCMAALPLQDIPASIAEMKRAIQMLGHSGIVLPTNVNGKNLDDPTFYPIYEAAQELGVPVAIHWGNSTYIRGAGTERFDSHVMTHLIGHPFEQMIATACIVCGGIVELFPRLRFAFLEAGCGWLPYWLQRLHEHYERRASEMPLMKREPLEYIASGSCYFGTEPDETMLPEVLRVIGDDYILYGSDYPHTDSKFPNSTKWLSDRSDLSESAKEKILGRNGSQFLGLETQRTDDTFPAYLLGGVW